MCPLDEPKILLVQTTCPDKESARFLAKKLLEQGLAGCINIIEGIESHYRWKGELKQGQEALMLIKTPAESYPELEMVIATDHAYELPEIIAVPLTTGLPSYLQWLAASASQDKTNSS
jgi:periplasmic divalent cation tolerance protein